MTPGPWASERITLERIEAAARAIDPVFQYTAQWICEPLCAELGARIALKAEVLNPIRSFKGRGADWLVQNLPAATRRSCAPLPGISARPWPTPAVREACH